MLRCCSPYKSLMQSCDLRLNTKLFTPPQCKRNFSSKEAHCCPALTSNNVQIKGSGQCGHSGPTAGAGVLDRSGFRMLHPSSLLCILCGVIHSVILTFIYSFTLWNDTFFVQINESVVH